MSSTADLTILGNTVRQPVRQLETFPTPGSTKSVTFYTEEMTSLCPVTGQPDFGSVEITYRPADRCIESKSLKLYLWSFRERAHFVEALADEIASDIFEATEAREVVVRVIQNVRGGIMTTAVAVKGTEA